MRCLEIFQKTCPCLKFHNFQTSPDAILQVWTFIEEDSIQVLATFEFAWSPEKFSTHFQKYDLKKLSQLCTKMF